MDGAELVARQRDRYWLKGDALVLDPGPFVAALEYATGKYREEVLASSGIVPERVIGSVSEVPRLV